MVLIKPSRKDSPELRKFPFPYLAALSICSDTDDTNTYEEYMKIYRFMNEEVGISFTNTFFPFHEDNKFSLFSDNAEDRKIIIDHIRKGAIDAIHSYGEKRSFTREDAIDTIKILNENDCKLDVWVDHGSSPSNLCKHRFYGRGDIPGEDEYHLDLTREYGIKFVWTEHLTNICGQGAPLTLSSVVSIFDVRHPLFSMINLMKTAVKIVLGSLGHPKYVLYRSNDLLRPTEMSDGQKLYEFIRFNDHYKGPARGDSFESLHGLISTRVLNRLKKTGGYSIIYVHLGRDFNLTSRVGQLSVNALRNLKSEFISGRIMVDCSSRILNYYITTRYLDWSFEKKAGIFNINIRSVNDPVYGSYVPDVSQLKGCTFYIPGEAKIFLCDSELNQLRYNPADHTGRESITIVDSKAEK